MTRVRFGRAEITLFQRSLSLVLNNEVAMMCQISFASQISIPIFGRKEALRSGGVPAQNETLLLSIEL